MSNYLQEEEILKGYDAGIMRRILGYVKPYLSFFLLSIVALIIATVGELAVPIIIQKATDNHILPYHRGVEMGALSASQRGKVGPIDEELTISGIYYMPAENLVNLSLVDKEDLKRRKVLLAGNFLVIKRSVREIMEIAEGHPSIFLIGDNIIAITQSDLRSLDKDEVLTLRRAHYQGLSRLIWALFVVLCCVFAFTFAQVYLDAYVGQMVMKDLRTHLYEHSIRLSLRYLDKSPVGRLVSRVTNDVETINEMFTDVLIAIFKDISVMIGVTVALFLLSPRLAAVTLLSLPPVFVVTVLFRRRARDAFRKVRLAVSNLNSFLSEHISGMRIVQLFVQERRVHGEFNKKNSDLLAASLAETRLFAVFRPLVDFLSTMSVAIIVYFGARFFLQDSVSLGILIAFLNLIRMFYHPVTDLSEKYNILQSAMAGAERVFSLLDTDDRVSEPEIPVSLDKVAGGIEFDNVSFWYKEGEPVLRDLTFRVAPGETVAIVGFTGAGKTTITSVLARLWDIQGGEIRIDGKNIREIPSDVLRRRIQSVLQDVFLFSGTILDNIRLGSNISMAAIRNAVEVVRADTFIRRLPKGLETELTERAGNLSTGQRQLLSFARVLAHNPDVLILDEATGNIDTETEKLIQEALARLLENRTSLVIAHRLSTIRHADRILVLHHGRLSEQGTHDELIAKRGMYHNLYQMQFLNRDNV